MGATKRLLSVRKDRTKAFETEKHLRYFCGATSTELSKVLGALTGELDHALVTSQEKSKLRSIQTALAAAERALHLALNLNYFAMHTRLDVETVEVSQVLIDTVDLLERELEARKIKVNLAIEANCYAKADSCAIQQIFLNLLLNAANSMPNGGKISLNLERTPHSLNIECTDTAGVIPREYLARVFEPYFNWKGRPENHSLALAVVKALVEAHGGHIEASESGETGTVFKVTIPSEPLVAPLPYRQKRKSRRVKVSLPCELCLDRQNIPGEILVLNLWGCQLRLSGMPVNIALESEVCLRINYFENEWIEIKRARVANSPKADSIAVTGLEFLDLEQKSRQIIHALVRSHSF